MDRFFFVFFIAVIVFVSPVFAIEHEKGIAGLLSTTYGGKHDLFLKCKLKVVLLCINIILFVFLIVITGVHFLQCGFADYDISIQSNVKYSYSMLDLNLGQFVIYKVAAGILGSNLVCLIMILISLHGRETVRCVMAGIVVLYLGVSIWVFVRMIYRNLNRDVDFIYGDFIHMEDIYMMLLVIFVSILTSLSFSMEYEANMLPVLLVTKNGGRKFVSVKMALALLLSNSLYLIYVCVVLADWVINFGFHFDMDIAGEYYLGAYIANPTVTNMGSILVIHLIGSFLSVDVTTLICLYLSYKLKRALTSSLLMIVVSFAAAMCSKLGYLGILANLSPLAFIRLDESYDWVIKVLDYDVGFYLIGFAVYIIAAFYLVVRLRNISMEKRAWRKRQK